MPVTILATLITMLSSASLYAEQQTIHGSGRVVTVSRAVSDFKSVAMEAAGTLHIQQGDTERLHISAEENLIQFFEIAVVSQKLVIRTRKNVSLTATKPVIFDLEVKNLREVELSGAGDISAPNLDTGQFALLLTGSGDVAMPNLQATELTVVLFGAGNVFSSGTVDGQVITIAGSGRYEAAHLASHTTEIVISGAGHAEIRVDTTLEAQITGAGGIRYHGNPRTVRTSVTGSGSILPGD